VAVGPGDIEGWSVALRSAGRSRTTIRAYQNAVAMFCDFACDGRYGWAVECEARFGEHPSQICHDWNTADHVADYEGDPARRPFTRHELQGFFDFADDRVAAARANGRKGGLAAWRDTAMFKVTYAWGLRRREAAMLDTPTSRRTRLRLSSAVSGCCRCDGARRCGAVLRGGATWPA
jgi:integrase/recombinase XerC